MHNSPTSSTDAESARITASTNNPNGWRLWGPYLSERAWGTVREDYSPDGSAWTYFPHDHARSRAYRWNEDGLGGISDIRQFLCFAVALWNGADPILKERAFGLTGPQGNHGEDVKEYYFHLDATPTASYLKYLYKYSQKPFPYTDLVDTNARRSRFEWEYELLDTGVFENNRYFDVFVEYAKATETDICIKITAKNHADSPAPLHILPTLWCRNNWTWDDNHPKPKMFRADNAPEGTQLVMVEHVRIGKYYLYAEGAQELLFTENETNNERLFGTANESPYTKDGINDYIVAGKRDAVNPENQGTKVSALYQQEIQPGESATIRLRLRGVDEDAPAPEESKDSLFGDGFEQLFGERISEADTFYERFTHTTEGTTLSADARIVQRQAYAGLIWSKQYYHYDIATWLRGDPNCPPPPPERKERRNHQWETFSASDIISMPDTWEYPWFAAWDLAFHMIPFAQIDPDFAKHQLLLMCREWYMHPNGQLPAYEWAFGDVNPPVHAWAALRVYKIERKAQGKSRTEPGDIEFLKRIFHKLLINFTWWVNRKDAQGNNVFEGGFLGLDNIGIFDRSEGLPDGSLLEQADGTAWMAMYCLNMLAIALELCLVDSSYEDIATKFAEHFAYITDAMNAVSEDRQPLWDDEDGFYYDLLHLPPGVENQHDQYIPVKVRSWVGLIPLFAVEAFNPDTVAKVPDFEKRFGWFLRHHPELMKQVVYVKDHGDHQRSLFSLVTKNQLRRILARVLDETEFLSPHGIRSVSKYHEAHPYEIQLNNTSYSVEYTPAESVTSMFGGNSNWRGPIWFPLNYLLIEALQKYDYVYGDDFQVEMPTGSGNMVSLWEVSLELSRRLSRLFLRDPKTGTRPTYGAAHGIFQSDPEWSKHLLFYEYFHGDNGAGLGASHQTGWTALVAKMLSQSGE